ncbi:oligosaccharide flippase family protein [Rhodococcus hoagii]|nr:oligosaccharide flippase family protein [Prescottella equi]
MFVMNGMSTQYRAALNRELRFTALAVSEVVSMGLGLIAGIGVAVAGFGVWALVVQPTSASLRHTSYNGGLRTLGTGAQLLALI